MIEKVSPTAHGRKPLHSPPRARGFEAQRLRDRRLNDGSTAVRAVNDHIRGLANRVEKGTAARPVRGGNTARAAACAFGQAISASWGVREMPGPAVIEAWRQRGWIDKATPFSPLAARKAMAQLAKITPLVEAIGGGWYRIHAGRPSSLPARILQVLTDVREADEADLARLPELAFWMGDGVASADSADQPERSVLIHPSSERARGDSAYLDSEQEQEGFWQASDGEQLWLESDFMGAVAGSMSDPAEMAEARPDTLPARPEIELEVWSGTLSDWGRAVPMWPQLQRAARLALAHLSPEGFIGTATELAATLAGFDERTRASCRSRAQLVRGLESLRRRGLLLVTGGCWRLPVFRENPDLVLFNVDTPPDPRPASAAQIAALERMGIETAGLGHSEAVALSKRLYTRRKRGQPHPRLLKAVLREQALAGIPSDLRATGRLDVAQARETMRVAMQRRRADKMVARAEGWWL